MSGMKSDPEGDTYRNVIVNMKRAFKTNRYGEHKMHQAMTYRGIKQAAEYAGGCLV